jgi:hypothetical protein
MAVCCRGPHIGTVTRLLATYYLPSGKSEQLIHDSLKGNTGPFVSEGILGQPPRESVRHVWAARRKLSRRGVREGSQDKIQTAINAGFGELFSPGGGDAPQWAEVAAHRGCSR